MVDRTHAAGEWVIAAGVQNHDVEAIARVTHLLDHPVRADRFDLHVALPLDARGGRDQVVAAAELHPVARIIEKPHGTRARLFQSRAEFLNRPLHGDLVGIAARNDVESQGRQCVADQFGVIGGVGQGAAGIIAVADDEGDSGFLGLQRGRPEDGHGQEY